MQYHLKCEHYNLIIGLWIKQKIFHFKWFYNMGSMENLPDLPFLKITFLKNNYFFQSWLTTFKTTYLHVILYVDFKYDIILTEFWRFNHENRHCFYSHLGYCVSDPVYLFHPAFQTVINWRDQKSERKIQDGYLKN